MKTLLTDVKSSILILMLLIAYYVLLTVILQYTGFRDDVGFLKVKQAYVHNPVWKTAFYIHVFSSILILGAGLTQFSKGVMARYPKLHRIIGRIYAWDILLINFPTGMVLAVTALGPLPSKLAFVTLDCLWMWFTYKGVVLATQRKFVEHKQYMMRSYALTCSAITLRVYNTFLTPLLHIDPVIGYTIFAWMGFVPNLLFVEWLIRRKSGKRRLGLASRAVVKGN
jgi:hypothetical protein